MKNLERILISFFIFSIGIDAIPNFGRGPGENPLDRYLYQSSRIYDKEIRPNLSEKTPVEVSLQLYVRELGPICLRKREFDLELTVRHRYVDHRLDHIDDNDEDGPENNMFITLVGEEANTIWNPDTFVRNERRSRIHDGFNKLNKLARVFEDGRVLISQRVGVTASCQEINALGIDKGGDSSEEDNEEGDEVDQENKEEEGRPFKCRLQFASYAYTKKDIVYKWEEENPVTVGSAIFLGNRIVYNGPEETSDCSVTTSTGEYSCLEISFPFLLKNKK